MTNDRAHLTSASAAILSLSVLMCLTAPAAAGANTPATSQRPAEARSLTPDQRRAMVALIGQLAQPERDRAQPSDHPAGPAQTVSPTPPKQNAQHRPACPPKNHPHPKRPAVRLALLNLPPPLHR